MEGEGGYEAYEVKNKRQKMRCLLLHKKKNIIYLFMKSLHGKKFLNGPLFSSDVIGGVESALWDGYPASTLAHGPGSV